MSTSETVEQEAARIIALRFLSQIGPAIAAALRARDERIRDLEQDTLKTVAMETERDAALAEVERLKAGRPHLDDCLKALQDNAKRAEAAEAQLKAARELLKKLCLPNVPVVIMAATRAQGRTFLAAQGEKQSNET